MTIVDLETIGNYAARFTFSDGHDTGIYSWDVAEEAGGELIESAWWNAPPPQPLSRMARRKTVVLSDALRGRGAYTLVPLAGADECYAFA